MDGIISINIHEFIKFFCDDRSVRSFDFKFYSLAPFTVVALFVSITDRWYISFEERAMAEKFGQTYLDYKRRVRRWI